MNRANKINVVLHLLVTIALVALASLVIAQSKRGPAPRRVLPTSVHKAGGRITKHVAIGKIAKLPTWVTRRHLSDKLTRMARTWHPKGSRAAGDQGVPRQTILLTKATPSANFSLQFAPSVDEHPFWSSDETYIYFDSDRQSATNTAGGAPFNIYRLITDGSSVEQITSGTDNKIEPNVSSQNNRVCYVSGGQITNLAALNAPSNSPGLQTQTTGFNLFFMDLNSGQTPQQLTNLNNLFTFTDVRHPSFSPGGTDIAFAGKLQGDTNYHIFTVNVAQGNITKYTDGVSNDYSPAWSPAVTNPQGATVIAYTTNALTFANGNSNAPVVATSVNPPNAFAGSHDEIFVFQPNPLIPAPKRITNFVLPGTANPNDPNVPHATNRNPAWSTTRLDIDPSTGLPRIGGVPPGQDASGNPTGQGQILLGFASTRTDSQSNGQPDTISPAGPGGIPGATDIYYMNATIGPDVRNANVVTVPVGEVSYAAGSSQYTGAHKLQTLEPQSGVDALDKPGLSQFDIGNTTSEDFPTFPQFINTSRIAFQSDRGNNYNLWAAAILDIDAPTLLKYDENSNEIVHVELANAPGQPLLNRFVAAGSRVRFKIRAVDYQSGIKYAYLQIKCPDSAPQASDGLEHKIFYNGSSLGLGQLDTTLFAINTPYEFDQQAIKASDSSTAKFRPNGGANAPASVGGGIPNTWPGFNRYTPNVEDFNAYSGSLNPPDDASITPNAGQFPDGDVGYWLPLQDDGTGTGTFQAEWNTPGNLPSDMVIDVILYDNAVYPFDRTGATQSNWKIYDNVWGFTTRPFIGQGQCLYISDYDTGQKFLSSRFGTGDFQNGLTNSVGLSYEGNPTESWTTEFSSQLFPQIAVSGTTVYTILNFLTPLGINSYFDGLTGGGGGGVTVTAPITGIYDIWRVQCRGPVPVSVLNTYGPRTITQPADPLGPFPARQVLVADKCVIWHSPYLGDLYVGPGTLLDSDTQTNLTAFVNRGGRLFVNGQDIAFGLTLGNDPSGGGGSGRAFLNNTLRAQFDATTGDDAIGPPIGFNGDYVNDSLKKNGDAFGRGVHPIGFETWYDVLHAYPMPNPGDDPPFNTPPVYLSNTTIAPTNRLYGCPNTGAEGGITAIGSPDQVIFTPPTLTPPTGGGNVDIANKIYAGQYGVDALYNAGTGTNNAAIMWYRNAQSGKVVFSPFGWEAINPEYYIAGTTCVFKNRRVELTHNVLDFLRTGRLVGQVRTRNSTGGPLQPIPGAIVRAYRPDPVTGVIGAANVFTAKTRSDGSFIIEGLDADGIYGMDALQSGFITQHATGSVFHGGYEGRNDFTLIQAQPGTIAGTVTTFGTNLPVPGATVQAVDESTGAVFTSLPSDAQGNYLIQNVPGNATYDLSVTNIAALGFSGSVPPVITGVKVASGQNVTGQNFQLTQPPGTLIGTVFVSGAATPTVIPGATITVTGGTTPPTGTTDANGMYSISLNPGSYQLVASAPGYASSAAVAVTIVSKQTATVNFSLVPLPPGTISGLVTTSPPNSIPVPGATITITTSAGQTITATTGAVQTEILPGTTSTQYSYNYKVGNIPAGTTVQVTATKAGYTPKPNPNTLTEPVTTGAETPNVNFILDPLASFNSDLTLVSSPFQYLGVSITDLFSIPGADINNTFAFITWDASQQKYVYTPTPPADTFHLGVGYFLQETNTATILALTNPNYGTAPKDALGNYLPFSIPLQNGWNLIGMPFTTSVDFSKLQIQEANGTLVNVPDAQGGGNPALGGALFTYEHGSYEIVFTLDPFRGYWLRAFRPVTLIVTPGASQNRAVGSKGRATVASNVTGDGWKLQLHAKVDDKTASNAYLGVSRKATDGYDTYKLEVPPVATKQNVQIAFEHKDWGSKSAAYSMDVRSASATSWEFTVTSNVLNAPVTVSWPNITTISRHEDMQITDLESKQTLSLRNRSSFVIPASQNVIAKHYRLDVQRATRNPLSLTNLTVVQVGNGRATGAPVNISYHLTKSAAVAIKITQNGRAIRNVTATGSRAAGDNQATWDLKTDGGAAVPANVYTVEVRAADEDGHVVRQVGTILITR